MKEPPGILSGGSGGGGEGGDCFYQSIKVFVMAVFISALLCISEHFVSSVLNQMGKL